MGYKKLSDEQEKQLVQEYISGIPVKDLMIKYNCSNNKNYNNINSQKPLFDNIYYIYLYAN